MKVFQLNASQLLSNSPCFIMNMSKHVQGVGAVQWGHSWKFLNMSGEQGLVQGLHVNRMTDGQTRLENITFAFLLAGGKHRDPTHPVWSNPGPTGIGWNVTDDIDSLMITKGPGGLPFNEIEYLECTAYFLIFAYCSSVG